MRCSLLAILLSLAAFGETRGLRTRTDTGVAVATGGAGNRQPAPGSTDRDRYTMEQELSDKALPEGAASRPVAGYLYFPMPAHKKASDVTALEYNGSAGKVHVNIPAPSKRK